MQQLAPVAMFPMVRMSPAIVTGPLMGEQSVLACQLFSWSTNFPQVKRAADPAINLETTYAADRRNDETNLVPGPSDSQLSTSLWTQGSTARPWVLLSQRRNLIVSVISRVALCTGPGCGDNDAL